MTKKTANAATEAAPEVATAAPEAAPRAARQTPLRKLTVKACFPVKVSELAETGEKLIGRIAGSATSTRTGATQYGPWTSFIGQFAAVSQDTGEIFVAPEAFVPGPLGDELIAGYKRALEQDASAVMQFSVEVYVRKNARGGDGAGYEYIVRSALPWQSTSPAIELLAATAPAALIAN